MTCGGGVLCDTGETALTYSAAAGNDVGLELIIRSFRRLGLDVDHANKSGRTALLIAVSRGHVECAAILAADGRADTRVRDPVTGLTADQLAVTCTGYPLKRPSPPDATAGSSRRSTAGRTGKKDAVSGGSEKTTQTVGSSRKTYDPTESFKRIVLPSGTVRPPRRSSMPSMCTRFDDDLTSSAAGQSLSREQTNTTTVEEENIND